MDKVVTITKQQKGQEKPKNNAWLLDEDTMRALGFNPKTGQPSRVPGCAESELSKDLNVQMRIKDEQDAITRYKWNIPDNIPFKLTGLEIERMLYYKAKLVFFAFKISDTDYEFMLLPFALQSDKTNIGIDFYGRLLRVKPLAMTTGSIDGINKGTLETLEKIRNRFLSSTVLDVVYKPIKKDNKAKEDGENQVQTEQNVSIDYTKGVLLYDYSKQLSENVVPRYKLQDSLLKFESKIIPYLNTKMLTSTGVSGVRVNSPDENNCIIAGGSMLRSFALKGIPWVPVTASIEFQDFGDGPKGATMTDFMQVFQSVENFRYSLYGIENGGLFQKKSHELEGEKEMKETNSSSPMEDGLDIRKRFCDVVNSIWNIGISVEKRVVKGQEDETADTEQNIRKENEGGKE